MKIHDEIVRLVRNALSFVSYAASYAEPPHGTGKQSKADEVRRQTAAIDMILNGLSAIRAANVLYLTSGDEDELLETIFLRYEMYTHMITCDFAEGKSPLGLFAFKKELQRLAYGTKYYIITQFDLEEGEE